MFWASLGCALFLLPLALLMEGNLVVTTVNGWLVMLALAAASQIGGQGFSPRPSLPPRNGGDDRQRDLDHRLRSSVSVVPGFITIDRAG